jgi:hypothetical protein
MLPRAAQNTQIRTILEAIPSGQTDVHIAVVCAPLQPRAIMHREADDVVWCPSRVA